MKHRFVEYVLHHFLTLLVDRETGVEYLKTTYSQVPIRNKKKKLVLTELPKLPRELEVATQKDYGRDLKQRFQVSYEKLRIFKTAILITDQKTGIEYFLSGGMISPLLTGKDQLKIKEK